MKNLKILVTGGAGFIGSAVIRHLIENTEHSVLNIDKLTYAGNLESLSAVSQNERYQFKNMDICDQQLVKKAIEDFRPNIIMHLAAESHVDRSIEGPGEFIQTNIIGTFNLLNAAKGFHKALDQEEKNSFRFHHISTDEVFGDLEDTVGLFTEDSAYCPSSPYSASKASSDHLVRAWHRTYGLPIIVTNCSNNYGPYQFPEKLIPHIILNAVQGKPLPVYGRGNQIRDWLYVEDHARALVLVANQAKNGATFNIGGWNEKQNIEVVEAVCGILEDLLPTKPKGVKNYRDLICFVKDRPGHDMRYAINASKIEEELGWRPNESFETGLFKTVEWYLNNTNWWKRVLTGEYQLQRIG